MSVIFTQEAERRRLAALQQRRAATPKKGTFELLRTTSLVEAINFARDKGWEKKKVQVKAYRINTEEFEYYVEPYEFDCKCPSLLKYTDYFD